MTRRLLALTACLLAAAARGAEPEVEDGVYVLTPDTFDSWIKKQPFALVEFYAPWCGHCQSLAPEWSAAAKKTAKLSPPGPLAKVDADAHKELGSRFDVSGYPTIKVFRNGKPEEYEGPREAKGIVSFVKKQLGITGVAAMTQLKSAAEAEALIAAGPVLLGLFRMPVAASAMFKTFAEVAGDIPSYTQVPVKAAWSASYKEDPVAKALEVSNVPALLFYPGGAAKPVAMPIPRQRSEFTEDAVVDFLTAQLEAASLSAK